MVSISYPNKHFNPEKITMLKIKTCILSLSLTPLLAINWQLPSFAQSAPSLGTAGSQSGANGAMNGNPPNPRPNSNPSLGTAGSKSGANGAMNGNPPNPRPNSSPSLGQGGSKSGSPSLDVAGGLSGARFPWKSLSRNVTIQINGKTISFRLRRPVLLKLKILLKNLLAQGQNTIGPKAVVASLAGGGAEAQGVANQLELSFNAAGVSPVLTKELLTELAAFVSSVNTSSITSSVPSVQLSQDQLVASNKALKTGSVLAQAVDTQANEDIDIKQFINAINIYNQILQESSPVTLQALSQNQEFLEIGKVLKELRVAID
jgi:hypothetical protein